MLTLTEPELLTLEQLYTEFKLLLDEGSGDDHSVNICDCSVRDLQTELYDILARAQRPKFPPMCHGCGVVLHSAHRCFDMGMEGL